MITSDNPLTQEELLSRLFEQLKRQQYLPSNPKDIPWDKFIELSDLVHRNFTITATAFTPVMRRLLFGLSFNHKPRHLVGVGTYVGYTFSWLLGHQHLHREPFESAIGIDIDSQVNQIARQNCAILGHGSRLKFIDAHAVEAIKALDSPIDLLYLDLDEPATGKALYLDLLKAAIPRLEPGALILAHDACVKVFARDFELYHQFIAQSPFFLQPLILPLDSCGVSLTVKL